MPNGGGGIEFPESAVFQIRSSWAEFWQFLRFLASRIFNNLRVFTTPQHFNSPRLHQLLVDFTKDRHWNAAEVGQIKNCRRSTPRSSSGTEYRQMLAVRRGNTQHLEGTRPPSDDVRLSPQPSSGLSIRFTCAVWLTPG
jgi:hypothetical protein